MFKLVERILFLKFVRILKFVKIREHQEFLKFIKFEFYGCGISSGVIFNEMEHYLTHPAPIQVGLQVSRQSCVKYQLRR